MSTSIIRQERRSVATVDAFDPRTETYEAVRDQMAETMRDYVERHAGDDEPSPVTPEAHDDARCSHRLRDAGIPYPRHCERCGLGPCALEKPIEADHRRVRRVPRYSAEDEKWTPPVFRLDGA